MNSKIKLALAAASAAGAAASLIGQVSPAFAGPSLEAISTQTYNAGAAFNLSAGQSFSVTGDTGTSSIVLFQETIGSSSAISSSAEAVGNAGVSTLTAAFDRNGFGNTASTSVNVNQTPSFAVQAGIIQLGGTGGTGGVTTAASSQVFNIAPALVLNNGGIPAIMVKGSGSPTGVIAASINNTSIGGSTVQGSVTESLNVINTLTAF